MAWRNWRGGEAVGQLREASREAIEQTLEKVVDSGRVVLTPREKTLGGSGRVVMVRRAAQAPAGIATFGGGPGTGHRSLPYAVRVHEKGRRHGDRRNYLRGPFVRLAGPELVRRLRQALSSRWRR